MTGGGYAPGRHAVFWLAGFAALAVLGGLIGVSKPLRRAVGRFRPVADPARRRGAAAGALAAIAIIGSSGLASVAGVLIASRAGTITPPDNALTLTGLALGTALVAGTSAYGRRGGVFGTVLAVALVTVVMEYLDVTKRNVAPLAVAAVAIGAGLVVTRLVEAFGRPRSAADADDDWAAAPATSTPSLSEADSWSPNRTGWTTAGTSGDDRWGNGDRWGSR